MPVRYHAALFLSSVAITSIVFWITVFLARGIVRDQDRIGRGHLVYIKTPKNCTNHAMKCDRIMNDLGTFFVTKNINKKSDVQAFQEKCGLVSSCVVDLEHCDIGFNFQLVMNTLAKHEIAKECCHIVDKAKLHVMIIENFGEKEGKKFTNGTPDINQCSWKHLIRRRHGL